ncbi:MAG: VOC family protein [Thalassobaculales bacterium]
MPIERIDHLVLTCRDVAATIDFYARALGAEAVTFAGGRRAIALGRSKINLHQAGAEYVPHARTPLPGSGDFCLIWDGDLGEVAARLAAAGITVEQGPVAKTGALGPITSLYFRDPDGNLVEVSTYDP